MSDGGKGSKSRPFSVTKEEYEKNWNNIFSKKQDNTDVTKNEYYDQLSTEDCFPLDFEDNEEWTD